MLKGTGRSVINSVVGQLREQILSGAFPSGARLTQRELAVSLGVSRLPVRDALRQLEGEGLVTLNGPGAVVSSMSIDDLQELYELRGALEPLASRLGVHRMGTAQVLVMQERLDRMHSTEEAASWYDAHREFHSTLYRQCQRARLIDLVEKFRQQTQRYLRLYMAEPSVPQHVDEEHRALLDAVLSNDPAQVEQIMTAHLHDAHRRIATLLLARQSHPEVPPEQSH